MHDAFPQATATNLSLTSGYSLTGTVPTQPYSIFDSTAPAYVYLRDLGRKQYELKDHLGNVRAVVSDHKLSDISGNVLEDFGAELLAVYNY